MPVDGRTRRITSADVAREAGVSRTTVSYVLNGTPHQKIPDATRRRVLDAVSRLEYAPSAAARALQRGRSDVVLCLLPDWPIGPAVGSLLELLSAAVAAEGFTLYAHPRAAGQPIADVWRSLEPAAVVVWEELDAHELAAMRAAGIAVTVALLSATGGQHGAWKISQQRTGRMQAEHLAATGHRLLGYAYPDEPRVLRFAEPRLEGARTACAELGLDTPMVRTVPMDASAAADAVRDWVAAGVTGVCAYNDETAMAVLAGARLAGVAVPEQLAVVGVDDIPVAPLMSPPLTTVTTDQKPVADYIGGLVVQSVTGRLGPPRPGSDIEHLVRRESA